jgi:hypothetical protein
VIGGVALHVRLASLSVAPVVAPGAAMLPPQFAVTDGR